MPIESSRSPAASSTCASSRRLALVFANGAYTQRPKLSKPVPAAVELRRKLSTLGFEVMGTDDQDLVGMRTITKRWLKAVEDAAEKEWEDRERGIEGMPPLIIFFAFCGHGASGRFLPVDLEKGPVQPERTYSFFDDFLFQLYRVLGHNSCQPPLVQSTKRTSLALDRFDMDFPPPLPGLSARVVAIIDTCRRLGKEEQRAFDQQKSRVANGRRHLLPCYADSRKDLMPVGGAEWDAASFGFLNQLGPTAPRVLLGLSGEAMQVSYDAVFMRSITDGIDRPVRLGGIFERAGLDTQRRTGYKQKPVVLNLGGPADDGQLLPPDLIIASQQGAQLHGNNDASPGPLAKRRSNSCSRLVARSASGRHDDDGCSVGSLDRRFSALPALALA